MKTFGLQISVLGRPNRKGPLRLLLGQGTEGSMPVTGRWEREGVEHRRSVGRDESRSGVRKDTQRATGEETKISVTSNLNPGLDLGSTKVEF